MDFGNPAALLSGIFIGLLGMALLMYGRKAPSIKCIVAGLFLCVFPYFVTSLLALWGITAACLAGLAMWAKSDA